MKLLLDTNVLVSKGIGGKRAKAVLRSVAAARWRIYCSDYILEETRRILIAKLGVSPRLAQIEVDQIRATTILIKPVSSRHRVPDDADDHPILQAAIAAGVDFLVTDDSVLQGMSPYEGIRIIATSEAEAILRQHGLFLE